MKRITKFVCVLICFEITLFMKAKIGPFLDNNLTIYKKHGGGRTLPRNSDMPKSIFLRFPKENSLFK